VVNFLSAPEVRERSVRNPARPLSSASDALKWQSPHAALQARPSCALAPMEALPRSRMRGHRGGAKTCQQQGNTFTSTMPTTSAIDRSWEQPVFRARARPRGATAF